MNKKLFFTLLIFCISFLSVYADDNVIQDELLNHEKFYNLQTYQQNEYCPIKDELLERPLYNGSTFQLEILKEDKFRDIVINDELTEGDFIERAISTEIPLIQKQDDEFIEKITDVNRVRKIFPKVVYDFNNRIVGIPIKLADNFNLRKHFLEGNEVPFISTKDFTINKKTYNKGTEIIGRIETVSASDKMGTPESIRIDNFYIPEKNKNINLSGTIEKSGANRSYWVYPLYQAGNICFYVAGFAFVPIHGGRVKISSKDTFTVYYEE